MNQVIQNKVFAYEQFNFQAEERRKKEIWRLWIKSPLRAIGKVTVLTMAMLSGYYYLTVLAVIAVARD